MNELAIEFGRKVRALRKEKGIAQEKLALLSGIDRSYVGRIERGEVNITLEKVYIIAGVLCCEIAELLPKRVLGIYPREE
jgi:transcriptional regulator with XRE-family HTH domain